MTAVLAHGGTAGLIAEIAVVVVGLAALGLLAWVSVRRKVREYEHPDGPGRDPEPPTNEG